jgi:hypothetical protein
VLIGYAAVLFVFVRVEWHAWRGMDDGGTIERSLPLFHSLIGILRLAGERRTSVRCKFALHRSATSAHCVEQIPFHMPVVVLVYEVQHGLNASRSTSESTTFALSDLKCQK